MRRPGRPLRALIALAFLGLLAAAALPTWLDAPALASGGETSSEASAATIAAENPPAIEPLEFEALDQDRARQLNAAASFVDRGPAARPFLLSGDDASRARAVDCLASAMWYEAGDDMRGQRAVGQVVLNRVRHPAFPDSVCGVVFQGAERKTGCQFTFTCDGAMHRLPSAEAIGRARARAWLMLTGDVAAEAGLATHYHTDWVHPMWSAQMDKIAQVGTHLFFRWHGTWGTPAAQRNRYRGQEAIVPALAVLSPAHGGEDAPQLATATLPAPAADAEAVPEGPSQGAEGEFQLAMIPGGTGNVQAMTALDLCGERAFCRVVGHVAGAGDTAVAFLYLRDRRTGVEKALWDCETFKRLAEGQCLTAANRHWLRFDGNLQSGPAQATRAS